MLRGAVSGGAESESVVALIPGDEAMRRKKKMKRGTKPVSMGDGCGKVVGNLTVHLFWFL
ncbi:unnamed protein product [Ilex paraguariensis]|uniref:Uncharacterized protein n=1 Tax=Ilex paraguariensis TaxID=185542 RepID=A0ABC8RBN4_9AQUA